MPNITHYFIFNNKFMLLDIDKNIWHLRKCIKFQEFNQNYKGKDDVVKEFTDSHKKEEEINDWDDNKGFLSGNSENTVQNIQINNEENENDEINNHIIDFNLNEEDNNKTFDNKNENIFVGLGNINDKEENSFCLSNN